MNNLGLGIRLQAIDDFSRTFDRLNMAFLRTEGISDEFTSKMQANQTKLRAGFALLGAGAAGLGASFALASVAGKFETSMTNLKVISGATAKQMDEFKKAVLGADHSMFGPIESANAMRELAQQGFTAQEALDMLNPVLNLATASLGELGITESAMVAAQAIKAFGLDATDTTKIVDEMSKSANISALSFRDLPIGIGVMARGAKAMDQTFEEALITLGLVRNTIPTIERASHAATISMERLAGGRHSKDLQALANVFDKNTGAIRPFLDIINDLTPKLNAMSVKDRKAFLIKGFGAEGLAGVQAIMTQLTKGIKTATGETVKGADAIKYLREQVAKAGGTAKEIADQQLNTFGGQIKLLKADLERLAVVVGTPFAQALRPLVEGLSKLITFIKNAFSALPEYVQRGIGVFVLLGSAFVSALGAGLALNAVMTLFGVTFGGLAASALALAGPLAVVALGIGGIILLVQALRVHSEQTGHGVIQFFVDMGRKIKLAFDGLVQAFSDGAFSGQVMVDMNRAENHGVKAFAIKVYVWANRIKNFLLGMVEGFREGVARLQPVFDRLVDALHFVADMFGVTVGAAKDNQKAFDDAGSSGKSLGQDLANVAAAMANLVTFGIMVAVGALEVFKDLWKSLGPSVMLAAVTVWGAVQLISGVLSGDGQLAWKGFFNFVYGGIKILTDMLYGLVKAFTVPIDYLNNALGIKGDLTNRVNAEQKRFNATLGEVKAEGLNMAGVAPEQTLQQRIQTIFHPIGEPPKPTASNAPAVAGAQSALLGLGGLLGPLAAPQAAPANPRAIDLFANLNIDGETMAYIMQRLKADSAARGYLPVSPAHP